ncbi:MAG: C2H2-type zinc finger protein [Thermoplasmata archaeon]
MSNLCTICGAPCDSPADLMAHMKTVHKNDDPASDVEMNPETHRAGLVCALCGRRFPDAQSLANHNLHPHPETHKISGPQPA